MKTLGTYIENKRVDVTASICNYSGYTLKMGSYFCAMPRMIICLFLCIVCGASSRASVELGKAPEPIGEFDFVRIPLKRAGNLILLEAKVEGQLGYFILDTGAPYLVLNATYFGKDQVSEQRVMTGVNGGSDTVHVIEVSSLELRSLSFNHLEADLMDLGAIENRKGIKVLGLLGLNMFLKLEMRLNLGKLLLELHRVDKTGESLSPLAECTAEEAVLGFKLKNNVILLKGTVNGQKLTFCFDTGAEVTVLSNSLEEDVYEAVTITNSMQLMGSSGRSVYVLQGNLDAVNFGIPLRNCRVVISDLAGMSDAFGVSIDGMIGFDLLARGSVVINFKKRSLTFCPSI
ncbi:MAG: pepsin/retropepsin-like aspartic protease family protein [Cryomorphaceae bacterium]